MKRLFNSVVTEEGEIDITPMLDVVFIMLIFFIVTASFVKESGISLNTPEPSPEQELTEAQPIVVMVTEFGEVKIQKRLVSTQMIESTIIRLRAENPDAEVVVKVEQGAKTGLVVQVVDGIRAAKYLMPAVSLVRS